MNAKFKTKDGRMGAGRALSRIEDPIWEATR